MFKKFPKYIQLYAKDCGPASLKIIAQYYNKTIPIETLRSLSETNRIGTNLENLGNASEGIGFRSLGVKLSLTELDEAPLPCILHWDKAHYIVLYKISKGMYYISDPALGLCKYNEKEFLNHWIGINKTRDTKEGIALLLEVTPKLYSNDFKKESNKINFILLKNYFKSYKPFINQLVLGLIIGSLIQLIFPLLTQSIIDVGIVNNDIDFIYIIFYALFAFLIGRITVDILRGWILLHLGNRVRISLISEFIIKLMGLPISYFDTKLTGDILQRIDDNERIRLLLTTSALELVFSVFNILIFSIVLAIYNLNIFFIYIIGTIIYFVWFSLFLKKRARLDYEFFSNKSKDKNQIMELVNGMQEIKLNNAEQIKRWKWEQIQVKLFKTEVKSLIVSQYQHKGTEFINELKNIILIIFSATLVLDGKITLGMMVGVMYIIGQLNSPLSLILLFLKDLQDAIISFKRLNEVNQLETEHNIKKFDLSNLNDDDDIYINNLNFKYPGANSYVLKDINITILHNKKTAIVGKSGSGKTTLMKLILKFYPPTSGTIKVNNLNLKNISQRYWRDRCGVVLQDGFLFNDTVINNISLSESIIDKEKLTMAVELSNIKSFIEDLPLDYNTIIGPKAYGISGGEKQRILIARAIYKDPSILMFDEATASLDTENEKIIGENLSKLFSTKTSLIIAHRLSTVKDADQIIVMNEGRIAEIGKHNELIHLKGYYYNLVKNQLDLGK
ncbi:MAG: peptidase domain-containing ABC transporter [Bacteroidota bacterium]